MEDLAFFRKKLFPRIKNYSWEQKSGDKGSKVELFWGGFRIDKKIVLNSFDSQNLFELNLLLLYRKFNQLIFFKFIFRL